jgi:hypothetical protein
MNISNKPRFISDIRPLEIDILSEDTLALLVMKVIPTPARITNKAEARPSNNCVKPIKNWLPLLALIAILKLTITMPNIASALARSNPVTLCFIKSPVHANATQMSK